MKDQSQIFAVLGIVLLMGGIYVLSRIPLSNRENIPEGTFYIWVPSDPAASDYKLLDVTVDLNIANDNQGVITFSFELLFLKARQYNFMVMQPMRVNNASASTRWMFGEAGTLNKAVTERSSTGGYLTRTSYVSKGREGGSVWIDLDVVVADPIAVSELGKRSTILTFWAGIYPDIDAHKENITYLPVQKEGVVLSIHYPSTWSLSFGDTFPQPDKPFTIRSFRSATWHLNFTRALPNYGETVTIVWAVPSELQIRDWTNFSGGLLAAIGAGILSDAFRQFLTSSHGRP